MLKKESTEIHVAAINDSEIIGILLLKPEENQKIKMRQVAVKPEWQGLGMGKKLVKFAEKVALKKGFFTIELNARNTAVYFYLSLDYNTIGNEFLEVGIPHIKMFKNLKH